MWSVVNWPVLWWFELLIMDLMLLPLNKHPTLCCLQEEWLELINSSRNSKPSNGVLRCSEQRGNGPGASYSSVCSYLLGDLAVPCFKRIQLHLVDVLSPAHHRGGRRLNSSLFAERAQIAS